MPPKPPYTIGSPTFDPDALFTQWATNPTPPTSSSEGLDFRTSILQTFSLPSTETYTYHAHASITLPQAQSALHASGAHGLHTWYRTQTPNRQAPSPLPPPPQSDIQAYTSLFSPSHPPSKSLTAFGANARKGSLRAHAARLLQGRHTNPWSVPRNKNHVNPALEFLCWACRELEWCGPVAGESENEGEGRRQENGEKKGEDGKEDGERGGLAGTETIRTSHPILPVLMHHFGCVCPSWEALKTVSLVARGREVWDIGSGNGYWAYMLRRVEATPAQNSKVNGQGRFAAEGKGLGKDQWLVVRAVDSGDSVWRTMWIGDTIKADGAEWLRTRQRQGDDGVLLLVYPITGGEFTKKVVEAYQGSTVVVAGTGNSNGYTGFKDQLMEEWMVERGWKTVVMVALPSFPGKDEVMFVFEREEAG